MSILADRNNVILEGKSITHIFSYGKKKTVALNQVDFVFRRGEIISIVGESGSGKTTLLKVAIGLLKPSGGELYYENGKLNLSLKRSRIKYWRDIQAIFQDPFSSFNSFFHVESILLDCIHQISQKSISKEEKLQKVKEACGFVNLTYEAIKNKYPFELSGGQMQRIMIARIFLLKPKLLILDEPTSMIDACSRATILDMILKLRDTTNMTIVFITHDIGLAYRISDWVYIMQNGSIIEQGSADETILTPKEEYTTKLINDVPKIHKKWDFGKKKSKEI